MNNPFFPTLRLRRCSEVWATVAFVSLFNVSVAVADDGWATSLREAGGNIYSRVSHPSVALEHEVLIASPDTSGIVEAWFWFRNDSDETVDLTAAFPVETKVPFSFDSVSGILESGDSDKGTECMKFLARVYDLKSDCPDDELGCHRLVLKNLKRLTSPRHISWAEAQKGALTKFEISQDGNPVDVKDVVVTANVRAKVPTVTENFIHALTFKPRARSLVKVRYQQHSAIVGASYGFQEYDWRYVLSTGATWKGPIGTLYVLLPERVRATMSPKLKIIGRVGNFIVYRAENYEPGPGDGLEWKEQVRFDMQGESYSNDEMLRTRVANALAITDAGIPHRQPKTALLAATGASSALKEKTNLLIVDRENPTCFTNVVVGRAETVYFFKHHVVPSHFLAAAATDGWPESAWCEGASGSGQGEFLEFNVSETLGALEIINGFSKHSAVAPAQVRVSYYGKDAPGDEYRPSSVPYPGTEAFAKNGRVRTLAISDAKGAQLYRFDLADTPLPQRFSPVRLPPGKYRATIVDAFSGSTYEDTCLGEVRGIPADDRLIEALPSPPTAPK